MAIREVQLYDNSVKSRTIAADTVIAADIASGGVSTAELASTCVTTAKIVDSAITSAKIASTTIVPADIDLTQAYNFTSTSSTFGNVKGTLEVQGVQVAGVAGANNFAWPAAFTGVPKTVASVTNTASTGAIGCNLSTVTASGGTLLLSAASTVDIVGTYGF